jgi:hypothetical protein
MQLTQYARGLRVHRVGLPEPSRESVSQGDCTGPTVRSQACSVLAWRSGAVSFGG